MTERATILLAIKPEYAERYIMELRNMSIEKHDKKWPPRENCLI